MTTGELFARALNDHQAGRLLQAERLYRQILSLEPQHAYALHYLGVYANQVGNCAGAVDLIRQSIGVRPDDPEAHFNLGLALKGNGQFDEAISSYKRAITLKPGYAKAHSNLGNMLRDRGQLDESIEACRQAILHNLDFAEAHNNLGNALKDSGEVGEAIVSYRRAMSLNANYAEAHSNLLLAMHFDPAFDAHAIAEEHRIWNRQHASPFQQQFQKNFLDSKEGELDAERGSRLRVGYVSGDFRNHVVSRFLLSLLQHHDHERFEIYCYSNLRQADAVTLRLRSYADRWCEISGLSDEKVAEQIRADKINILVDLSGHTAGNRLLVFARKPAPLQVTYLGYPDTTGLSAMDYRLSDYFADPVGLSDHLHAEKVHRLPLTNWCYTPWENAPAVRPPPSSHCGYVTFGSFNNVAKITDSMLEVWGQILTKVPESRLLLKGSALARKLARDRVSRNFAAQGISVDRLSLLGPEKDITGHLDLYGQMDIALDTFPYHGTTTTCDALWMGVPVITLAGHTHVSRVGLSFLNNMGLANLIATTPNEYIRLAVALAGDRGQLERLRANLRPRLSQSPIMDAPRFTRDIEQAYRQMWSASRNAIPANEPKGGPSARPPFVAIIKPLFDQALKHHQAGRLPEAERLYRQILDQDPNHAYALHYLGVHANQVGRSDAGVDLIRRSIALRPDDPEAHFNLGIALKNSGQSDEAVASYRQAIALNPGYAKAYANLGNLLRDRGQLDESIVACRKAIDLSPGYPDSYNSLGVVLAEKRCLDDAIAAYRQAIDLRADYAEAYNNLGVALKGKGLLDEALAACRKAIELKPRFAEAHNNLGNVFKDQGRIIDAIDAYRRAITIRPGFTEADCNLVFTLLLHPSLDDQTIAKELQRWNRQHAGPLKRSIQPHLNDRSPERRLRVGYVSPDFRDHVVGRNLLPLFQRHDHEEFEITCYANVSSPDAATRTFQQKSHRWRNIVGMSNLDVASQIRDDGIDLLVDLSLHTARNRLLVFAQKPAPVQLTFAGYPGSTGLKAIDYRLSDPYLDPAGSDESLYSEETIRLPDSFWCYDPLDMGNMAINALPASDAGYMTFGCLNNFCKINQSVIALWAQVLRQVEGSRLILLAQPGGHRQRTLDQLNDLQIDASRVEFVSRQSRSGYMHLYHRIDLGLDSFPYNGHTTSLDSLWMGVPVVTLTGRSPVSRAGWSQLSNLGLTEFVGYSAEQFVQIATDWAGNQTKLRELRSSLRQRMQQSPLMDGGKFTRSIEAAYRQVWHRWCAAPSGQYR